MTKKKGICKQRFCISCGDRYACCHFGLVQFCGYDCDKRCEDLPKGLGTSFYCESCFVEVANGKKMRKV